MVRGLFTGTGRDFILFYFCRKSGLKRGMVAHQGGLSSGRSFVRVVSHQGGRSSGWSLIRVVFRQGGISSGRSLIRVVSHQGGLSSGRSLIMLDFHQGLLRIHTQPGLLGTCLVLLRTRSPSHQSKLCDRKLRGTRQRFFTDQPS